MNYLNHINFKEVIRDLVRIKESIDNIHDYNKKWNDKFTELLGIQSSELNLIINQIKTLTPNTLFTKLYVDIYAFKSALENSNIFNNIEIEYEYDDGETTEWYDYKDEIVNCILKVYYNHDAYSPSGYLIGYENVLYTFQGINRLKEGLTTGYPGNLSNWIINPDNFEITILNTPPEEKPSYDDHDSDCEIFRDDDGNDIDIETIPHDDVFDNCNCGLLDNWEGYYPPDEDFFWSEMDNIVYNIMTKGNLPEAIFDNSTSIWTIDNQIEYKFK